MRSIIAITTFRPTTARDRTSASAPEKKKLFTLETSEWELFDLEKDPFEQHNLYGEAGQEALTASLKAELQRLKQAVKDEDQLANEQLPNGVGGPVAKLRGK